MSAPYNPLEEELCWTRQAMELLQKYGFGAAYTTRSALCARDAVLLKRISLRALVCARLTITCADDDLCRKIEPHVSPSSERFDALETLAKHDVFAGVWLNPVLPFLTDTPENIRRSVQLTADHGERFVVCFFGMTLRTGNREYYNQALEQEFPGVRAQYLRMYGNAYEIPAREAEKLYDVFREACTRHHLLWEFEDINREMFSKMPVQTSFL